MTAPGGGGADEIREQLAEREHKPTGHGSQNAYMGVCWCQDRDAAWPCPNALDDTP